MHPIPDPEPFLHNLYSINVDHPHTTPSTNILPLECISRIKKLKDGYIYCTEALEHTNKRHSESAEDAHEFKTLLTAITESDRSTSTQFKLHTSINFHAIQAKLALYPQQTIVNELIHNLQYVCNIAILDHSLHTVVVTPPPSSCILAH